MVARQCASKASMARLLRKPLSVAMPRTIGSYSPSRRTYARGSPFNADRLAGLLTGALTDAGVVHRVQRAGNMLSVFFTDEPVNDFAAAKATETWRFPPFFHALLEAGVYPPCSAFETWFVSTAHNEAEIDATVRAAHEALREAAAQ